MQKPWYKTSIGRFRTIAICEGISFLVLLCIAMPLKYFANFPQAVLIVGWLHGFLFITYMFAGLDVKMTHNWSLKKTFLAVVASIIPFGPFILDKRILQKEME
ncbi:MAG: DUF3817 domain-containing protein [Fimbriimonadaceae bacterium]|nr:DUF3817 domain-containing protein [Chitinophagales bacterium]